MQTDNQKVPQPPDIPEPVQDGPFGTGTRRRLYRLPNNLGASVLSRIGNGLCDMLVIRWIGPSWMADPAARDAAGLARDLAYLSEDEVRANLAKIAALPTVEQPVPDISPAGELPPEPPRGSVALDRDGDAWQSFPTVVPVEGWYLAGTRNSGCSWAVLAESAGPLTVVYTPPTDADRRHAAALSWAKGEQKVTARGEQAVLTAPAEQPSAACTGCGLALRYAGVWVDGQGRGWCASSNAHVPASAPNPLPLAVYVIHERDAAGVGPWFPHDQTAYPTGVAAMAALEREYGALEWDDEGHARYPAESTACWRIVELPLAGSGPTGGAR